ncbi:DUF5107 domain-containing protein [Mangrovibacter plantisponsor]|uniref:Tetratricopeptide repeat protein n=1 Tax=Mangrovibacter plantisponsor TaxID=451513 RepID=A0A317Q5Z2_9ENTR|nr:DUF5107 domain-containing protein [Mangrovibacter plantisponsor]PWW10990.1 tetratricopeptide repeat protein [Mangrovibacter plantisponsor]
MYSKVSVKQETITLPTWTTDTEDPNPMFLEKRVYQGSSGAVYPYGVIDTITGNYEEKEYQAIWIENDFIRVMLLPELGGRIHRAYDKVMQRDFVYYNEVIKPALVGLVGPWISGGIEFNWPQHHRPTTFMPVDVNIQQHDSGAATVWLGELEPMRGLQVMTGFKLYPEKALIEITGKIFNPNSTPRHFLWWANPAVKGGDGHQSVFPPDVTAVFDHGRRAVSSFPIAHGEYYKVDYSAGVDISRYKNIPVPTSYMADKSDYDFVGAWHHGENGGLLHIADHHVSPGKKQWTWGYGDFGQAWDRNLTDKNGPYIELMTGVFTDNQPDFTWLAPFEEKVFVQNFLPYSQLGTLQNASTSAAIKLERDSTSIQIGVYAIEPLHHVKLELRGDKQVLWSTPLTLEPAQAWLQKVSELYPERLTLALVGEDGQDILSYLEHIPKETPLPSPATAPALPAELKNCDELFFIGQHLEQYLNASRSPYDYYLRALDIDPYDYRCNVALATLEYNRANWKEAESYAKSALQRAHKLNKNPQSGEASHILACAQEKQGRLKEAYDNYFKSSWSADCRDTAFYHLARLELIAGNKSKALSFCKQSLRFNGSNNLAMALCALLQAQTGKQESALQYIDSNLVDYPLSYALHYAHYAITQSPASLNTLATIANDRGTNSSVLAGWLVTLGMSTEALSILTLLDNQETLPLLWRAALTRNKDEQHQLITRAKNNFALKVRFPNLIEEVNMLHNLQDYGFAQYLLGCFHYSKKRYDEAVSCWSFAVEKMPDFAPVHRLLGIWAWNKRGDFKQAEASLQRAIVLEPNNARLLFERDYLYKITGQTPTLRLQALNGKIDVALMRDDLTAELLNMWNIQGEIALAAKTLAERDFHPWEGGEGRITGQYLINKQRQAIAAIQQGQFNDARELLTSALTYPLNLGEGRLAGQSDNDIWYLLGWCAEQQGETHQAEREYQEAIKGGSSLDAGRYYNDQPVDYLFYQALAFKKTGQPHKAEQMFRSFINWSDKHCNDEVTSDFFAVSLPDLVVLDSDQKSLHLQHCLFVSALGYLGLNEHEKFKKCITKLLEINPAHDKAHLINIAREANIYN